MAGITARIDEAQLARVRRELAEIQNGAPRALAAALNKTASKAKTEASKAIRAQIRLSAAYVRQRLQGPNDNPANKAYFTKLESKITAPTRGLLLSHFLRDGVNSPLSAPVKVKVKPSGSYKQVGTAPGNVGNSFLIKLRNNNLTAIAQRRATAGARGGTIDVLYGPSLSQVLASKGVGQFRAGGQNFGAIDAIGPAMNEYLAEQVDNEILRVLARFGSQ